MDKQMGRLTSAALLAIFACFLPLTSVAETYYVGDTLRVGIRAEPGNSGPSLAVVSTGAKLEVLERNGRYIKIRSPSGIEGWVKSAYLSRQKPSIVLLEEAKERSEQLEQQISYLKKSGTGSSSADPDVQQRMTQLETERDRLQQELVRLKQEIDSSDGFSGDQGLLDMENVNMTPIYFAIGGFIFILSVGFLFGVGWHRHQVTKRLGGMTL